MPRLSQERGLFTLQGFRDSLATEGEVDPKVTRENIPNLILHSIER